MISDKRIIDWRNALKKSAFGVLRGGGKLDDSVYFGKINNDNVDYIGYNMESLSADAIRVAISNVAYQINPDAFVFIGTKNIILFPESELEDKKKELDKAGSIRKMKGSTEVLLVIYETKILSNVDMHEIIREGEDVVVNEETILDGMTFSDELFYTGILNVNKVNSIVTHLN